MVDAIGVKTGTVTDVGTPRAPAVVATPVSATMPASAADTAQTQASALARTMASAAPVDAERVAQIRKAIANGTFPILPATIADRLMALRLEWNSDETGHDQA